MRETAPTTAPPARKRPAPRKPRPAGHLVGYARVSTAEQDPALQLDALGQAGCWRVFTDHASGSREDRSELVAALDSLRPGDSLVVWRLDRLGRSLPHLIDTVTALAGRGVGFWSVTESIDTTTAGGRLVFHLFGALAAPPLPGQLTLDLPGLRLPVELPAPAPRRARPAVPGEPGATAGGGVGVVPRLLPTRHVGVGPGVVAWVPVAVWAVWDGEDLVGVYADWPAPAGVHRAPAHPPAPAVDTATTGPAAVTGVPARVPHAPGGRDFCG